MAATLPGLTQALGIFGDIIVKLNSFNDFLAEQEAERRYQENFTDLQITLEHVTYKNIPGTSNSVRHDKGNTNTKTQAHAHVYAKRNGQGKELYSVNMDGTGHDGSTGTMISNRHADYFRDLGYRIPDNLTLESISYEQVDKSDFEFFVLTEDA